MHYSVLLRIVKNNLLSREKSVNMKRNFKGQFSVSLFRRNEKNLCNFSICFLFAKVTFSRKPVFNLVQGNVSKRGSVLI